MPRSLCTLPFLALLLGPFQNSRAQTLDPSQIRNEINGRLQSLLDSTPVAIPVVFRLDQITDELLERSQPIVDPQDRVNFLVNGLSITDVWPAVLGGGGAESLRLFAQLLLGMVSSPDPLFEPTREELFDMQEMGRNITQEIEQAYLSVVTLYGKGLDLAPLYMTTYGFQFGTNAAASPGVGGSRCFARFNLGAQRMIRPDYFQIAAVHETWHCVQFQNPGFVSQQQPVDLLFLTLFEGVSTYLTSLVHAEFEEADLLFWSEQELQTAQDKKTEILLAYEADRNSTDPAIADQWYVLGKQLLVVPGAPSRSGYYVAWLAIQAYVEQSTLEMRDVPQHILDLTETPEGREQIWQTLVRQEDLGIGETSSQAVGFRSAFWMVLAPLAAMLISSSVE